MPLPSKKRSHSLGRSELLGNDQTVHDVYQTSGNSNNLFPVINPKAMSYSSAKTNYPAVRPKLLQYIEENVIGRDHVFQGPWGLRRSEPTILWTDCISLFSSSDLLRLHSIGPIVAIHRELHPNLRTSSVRHLRVGDLAALIIFVLYFSQIRQYAQ